MILKKQRVLLMKSTAKIKYFQNYCVGILKFWISGEIEIEIESKLNRKPFLDFSINFRNICNRNIRNSVFYSNFASSNHVKSLFKGNCKKLRILKVIFVFNHLKGFRQIGAPQAFFFKENPENWINYRTLINTGKLHNCIQEKQSYPYSQWRHKKTSIRQHNWNRYFRLSCTYYYPVPFNNLYPLLTSTNH